MNNKPKPTYQELEAAYIRLSQRNKAIEQRNTGLETTLQVQLNKNTMLEGKLSEANTKI